MTVHGIAAHSEKRRPSSKIKLSVLTVPEREFYNCSQKMDIWGPILPENILMKLPEKIMGSVCGCQKMDLMLLEDTAEVKNILYFIFNTQERSRMAVVLLVEISIRKMTEWLLAEFPYNTVACSVQSGKTAVTDYLVKSNVAG